jgi:tight adherence protein C
MDGWWLRDLGLFGVFCGVFGAAYFALGLLFAPKESKARTEEFADPIGESAGLAHALRFATMPLSVVVAPFLPESYGQRLAKYLTNAGIERKVSAAEFASFQLVMMGFFCAMGFLLRPGASLPLTFALLGFVYPYWWLYDKKNARQRDIVVGMPDIVDMLALSTASGLDFISGLRRIGELVRERNPFVGELKLVYQNIKLGMSTEDALKLMAERVDSAEVHAFVSILIQAQKMGSSIAEVLKGQATRMRQDRFMRAERAGAAAAQKLLIPMMLFLFPIIFGVVFGPYVLKWIYSR